MDLNIIKNARYGRYVDIDYICGEHIIKKFAGKQYVEMIKDIKHMFNDKALIENVAIDIVNEYSYLCLVKNEVIIALTTFLQNILRNANIQCNNSLTIKYE
jgi:hypothetical protein